MKTIYLSGPMRDCTEKEIKQWREYVKKQLPMFKFLDPAERGFNAPNAIKLDKTDIYNSDIILTNCWKPSAGTSMEIMYAYTRNKIIITIAENDISGWITEHSNATFSTINKAINYIRRNFK